MGYLLWFLIWGALAVSIVAIVLACVFGAAGGKPGRRGRVGPTGGGGGGATGPTGVGGGGGSTGSSPSVCGTTVGPYIVGTGCSDFATIQGAVDAARTAGANAETGYATVYVRAGNYSEDVVVYNGIALVGISKGQGAVATANSFVTLPVVINGTVTANFVGASLSSTSASMEGITVQNDAPGTRLVSVLADSSNQVFKMLQCDIRATNGDSTINSLRFVNGSLFAQSCTFRTQGQFVTDAGSNDMILSAQDCLISGVVASVLSASFANVILNQCRLPNCGFDFTTASAGFTALDSDLSGFPFVVQTPAVANSISVDLTRCTLNGPILPGSNATRLTLTNCSSILSNDTLSPPTGASLVINSSAFDTDNNGGRCEMARLAEFPPNTLFHGFRRIVNQVVHQQLAPGADTLAQIAVPVGTTLTVEVQITGAMEDHTDITGGSLLVVVDGGTGIIGTATTDIKATTTGSFNASFAANTLSITLNSSLAPYNWVATITKQYLLNSQ